MKIIPLQEGSFTIDKTKVFVPFDKAQHDLQQRPAGSLLVEIQPFAVVTGKDVLLIDTGLGFYDEQGRMQIHRNLEANGINPDSISKVLLSHLHKDHAGGIQDNKNQTLGFPSATYYLHRQELTYAKENDGKSYEADLFNLLENSSQLKLLDDKGSIDGYIDYELTGAHSPFHVAFTIHDGEEKIFYGGDVAPQLQQMKNRFVAKYDYDGKKSMELRNQWWVRGKEEGWIFLFYHDIKSAFIKAN